MSECRQDGKVFRIKSSREVRSNPPAFARKILADRYFVPLEFNAQYTKKQW